MGKDAAHVFVGLYDAVEVAEDDFADLKRLHAEGLAGAYDAAVVTRDADGTPQVVKKRHTGRTARAGAGIGALIGVLFPPALAPMALLGAGTGALAQHARDGLPKDDAEELAEALSAGEAALVVVSDKIMVDRVEQVLPRAKKRIVTPFDVRKDDFAEALRQAETEG